MLKLVYSEQLFGPLSRNTYIEVGILIIVLNCAIYWRLSTHLRPHAKQRINCIVKLIYINDKRYEIG